MKSNPAVHGPISATDGDSTFERIERARRRLLDLISQSASGQPTLGSLYGLLARWSERRFAAACSRELLELYRAEAKLHPLLTEANLYRPVVESRGGVGAQHVEAILECAQQSFADWPVNRKLKFRDVVHCLIVTEYFETHPNASCIHADLRRVISKTIPREL